MTESSHAVFVSYASQDAEAAQKIAEALRAGGIESFLDRSELRGGDAWDQKIRHEIHDCALFIPMISQHTQERLEGYFRHEWNLAIERTHHMAQQKPFLVPVVVDGTRDREAFVPDAFRAVQWTHLPGGETSPSFVERIKRLLSPELSPMSAVSGAAPALPEPARTSWRSKPVLRAAIALVIFAVLAYFLADKFWMSKHATPAAAAFAPPPHSIAVLPFVNMSGDKEQEYFSDGLTEEILNSLAHINELQVSARTSAFSFKGKDVKIETIAHALNVGSILEGSVRRSGHTVRVTAQLNNAVTGFHLWSQTYDRDLSDVLKLQTDIANAVANALRLTMLDDVGTKIELGGTHTPAAFDAYLRASKMYFALADDAATREKDTQAVIAEFTEAIRLDPNYALAYADRSHALKYWAETYAKGPAIRDYLSRAHADANKAVTLAPDLAEGHLALRSLAESSLDLPRANQEAERALALAPGNARVLRDYGQFAVLMGHTDAGLAAAHRAVTLDPLNADNHLALLGSLFYARRYREAVAAYMNTKALDPNRDASGQLAMAYWGIGDFEAARIACETSRNQDDRVFCLAVVYDRLGRHSDAQTALASRGARGDADAMEYAEIYAQWGLHAKALESLEIALRLRDPGLVLLKTDPFLDPLRQEPRFQAAMRELKFPD